MQLLKKPTLSPPPEVVEVVIDRFPVGQVTGHHAPRAARAGDVEDAVEDFLPAKLPWSMVEPRRFRPQQLAYCPLF